MNRLVERIFLTNNKQALENYTLENYTQYNIYGNIIRSDIIGMLNVC